MQVTKELVEYVSDLSKIKLNEEQTAKMIRELSEIIDYMDVLNRLDTENTEPLSHIFPITNVMREDVVFQLYDRELLLKNAPERTEETFVVPQTVE